MSGMGQRRLSRHVRIVSANTAIADIAAARRDFAFVPDAEVTAYPSGTANCPTTATISSGRTSASRPDSDFILFEVAPKADPFFGARQLAAHRLFGPASDGGHCAGL